MSVGPVSGSVISVALPPGKTVFWTVTAQASYNQFVKLIDGTGAAIFQSTGASTGGHAPTQIGQGSFVVNNNGSYSLAIGINGGQSWSTVMWDDMTVNLGDTIICSNLNFIAEDGADQDFNDVCVSISWFNSIG